MNRDGSDDGGSGAGTPRQTRLYGAIDPPDHYPPTISDEVTNHASAEMLAAGDMLVRYRIGDVLGRGGMGEVLSARDEQIGRSVAIKRLRVAHPSDEVLARFLREARIQGRLEHPAVVPVHELWTGTDGQPFFVMKQLAGTTLGDVLIKVFSNDPDALEQFTFQRLLRAFADICLAIEFAHTRGVVHRDLKPANVVLGDFGEVYVLDWGIAKVPDDDGERQSFADIETVIDAQTSVGAILGTPGYISPEQIRGDDDLDGRADVYALGCILFEILTLQPLHPRGQPAIASALHGVDARATLRAPERQIPPELDAICTRATAIERTDRYDSARQLGDAVQRFLDGNRDLELRKELARVELRNARAALSGGNGPVERRDALRAAARALALDPTNREPADLVGRLMLEPPKDVPAEVEHELDRLDHETLRTSAKFGIFAAIAYLLFFPVLYLAGFREPWYLIGGPATCVVMLVVQVVVVKHNPYLSGYIAIALNLAMFGLFAFLLSPVIVGPGPAVLMVTLMVTHRRLFRPWVLAGLTWILTLSPWLLELAGLRASSFSVDGGNLVLHTGSGQLESNATFFGLMLYIAALAHLAAFLSRLQDDERRGVRRSLQLQTWQLRQLVPKVSTLPPI